MIDMSVRDMQFLQMELLKQSLCLHRQKESSLIRFFSGKGMTGLIDMVRNGDFNKKENILFLHSGGSAALFAYENELLDLS